MWRSIDRGRTLYQYRPTVCYKFKGIQFHSFTDERRISQLRTGYVPLNEYLHKCGLKDSKECSGCGDVESVPHFLLSCLEYENQRETMRMNLFRAAGIVRLDLNMLLSARPDDDYKDVRGLILEELESFIKESKRFEVKSKN